MLVLNVKKRGKVHLGKDIQLHVLDIRRGHIKLGVEAPQECKVMREKTLQREIERRIKAGEPLSSIEDDLDLREQLGRATH